MTGLDDTIMLQLTTDANVTHITVGSLHPFYRYTADVAAVTIGEGTSISVTVRTEEDGESHKKENRIARNNIRSILRMPIGIRENPITKT